MTLTVIVGWVLWQSVALSSISEIRQRIDSMQATITGIRLSVIALIAITWPLVINGIHQRRHFSSEKAATLKSLRWRIVIWLIVIELLLGQNLISQMLGLLQADQA
jgi:uncharacterized membrane protein